MSFTCSTKSRGEACRTQIERKGEGKGKKPQARKAARKGALCIKAEIFRVQKSDGCRCCVAQQSKTLYFTLLLLPENGLFSRPQMLQTGDGDVNLFIKSLAQGNCLEVEILI